MELTSGRAEEFKQPPGRGLGVQGVQVAGSALLPLVAAQFGGLDGLPVGPDGMPWFILDGGRSSLYGALIGFALGVLLVVLRKFGMR